METRKLPTKKRDLADRVMNVYTGANPGTVRRISEEDKEMCKAIDELFADRTAAANKRAEEANKRAEKAEKECNEYRDQIEELRKENARLKAALAT